MNAALTNDPGIYQLLIRLDTSARIAIGRLGDFDFPAGCYLYTGSAMGGLRGRVERHLRSEKRRRWHIDYLLEQARVEEVLLFPTREQLECTLARLALEMAEAQVIAPRFGASDCRCAAHLAYVGALRADAQENLVALLMQQAPRSVCARRPSCATLRVTERATMQLTIEIPDDIAADLQATNGADLSRAAVEMIALEGYRSGNLTHAQVGRMLGSDHPLEVEAFLKEHDVPLPYTLEDLEQDRETLRKLGV